MVRQFLLVLFLCSLGYCDFDQLEDTIGINNISIFSASFVEKQFQCVYTAFVEAGKSLPQGKLSYEEDRQFMEKSRLLAQKGLEEFEGNIDKFVFDYQVEKWRSPQKHEELAFYRRVHLQDDLYAYAAMTYNGLFLWDEDINIFDFMPWKTGRVTIADARGGIPCPCASTLDPAEPTREIAPESVKFVERENDAEIQLGQHTRIVLRKIPPGIIRNGSPMDNIGRVSKSAFSENISWEPEDDSLSVFPLADKPLHDVVISKPFWLGELEMCYDQYRWLYSEMEHGDDRKIPMSDMVWDLAMDYCGKLNELFNGKLPQGYKFSLPLEEQWEYACRAGIPAASNNGTEPFAGGTREGFLEHLGWHAQNRKHRWGARAGMLQPNAWGLFDMHGNLGEWCYDNAHSQAFLPGVPVAVIGIQGHVLRGGSFEDNPEGCRSASRATARDFHAEYLGFRLALIPEELTPEKPSPFSEEAVALRGRQLCSGPKDELCFNLPEGVKLTFEKIPAGTFLAGSPEKEAGRINSEYWRQALPPSSGKTEQLIPHMSEEQHPVSIGHSFWLGQFEVTREQYAVVVDADVSILANRKRPMTQIRWEDAVAFCEKLNVLCAEQLPAGYRFALPTEEQWEYACRAGTTTALNSGKDLTQGDFFCPNLAEVAWFQMNSGEHKRDVGLLKPNAWGLYDMHGNVWEWCVCTTPVDDNPLSKRILRGGSWYDPPRFCRSAMRRWLDEDRGGPDIGFRVALVPVESDGQQTEAKR